MLNFSYYLLILFYSLNINVHNEVNSQDLNCEFEDTAFEGGEKLVYKAYYNLGFIWVPAGEAVFTVHETKDYYEVNVVGNSYPAYDSFFKLRDRFYTKVNKHTLLTEKFERNVKEDDYSKYERIEIDQKTGLARSYIGKTENDVVQYDHNFEYCIQDLLSLLYSLRNVNTDDFTKGDFLSQNLLFDGEIFNIKVRYEGKNNIKVRNQGRFSAIKVVPDLITGHVFNDGDQMEVWVSNDSNKIPLMVETPLKIGSLKAVLKSYEGLRNPLKSKF